MKPPQSTPNAMERRSTFAASTVGKSFCPHPQERSPWKNLAAVADRNTRKFRPARGTLVPWGGLGAIQTKSFMMNQNSGWMGGWSGGGMWIGTVIGVLVVVLLLVAIIKMSKK